MHRNTAWLHVGLLSIMVSVSACQDSQPMVPLSQNHIQPQLKSDAFRPLKPFLATPVKYTGQSLRDPFSAIPNKSKWPITPQGKTTVLTQWHLNTLQLRGTLTMNHLTFALFETPTQQVVKVQLGDYIGTQHGQIIAISTHTIQVLQWFENIGAWRAEITQLQVNPDATL